MIISKVKLVNFLAHESTELGLDSGVNVFVGPNGAGKSSIIDAITFALFGQHTRKNNRGLIRRGATHGYASVSFSVDGNNFQVTRSIDSKGTVSARLDEVYNGEPTTIVEGERKKFDESVTRNIEEIIGLGFEKLKMASIVRQGELDAIIRAKPKEFKEFINSIIGIDKLDRAAERLKGIIKEFRGHVKGQTGYDDTDIAMITGELQSAKKEHEILGPQLQDLQNRRDAVSQEIAGLTAKIEEAAAKAGMLDKLRACSDELTRYVGEYRQKMVEEMRSLNERYRACSEHLNTITDDADSQRLLDEATEGIERTVQIIQEKQMQRARLVEKLEIASRLEVRDGRCPVCKSKVDGLGQLFDQGRIRSELKDMDVEAAVQERIKADYENACRRHQESARKVQEAQTWLALYKIKGPDDLEDIRQDILKMQDTLAKIPNDARIDQPTAESIDLRAKELYDEVSRLREATRGFEPVSFDQLKGSLDAKQAQVGGLNQKIGALQERFERSAESIQRLESVASELGRARRYADQLLQIQDDVYGRDGYVASGLRSWSLEAIATAASEYLERFNTRVQSIRLTEKERNVTISCQADGSTLDLESLSGGEQVSVALALRFGMARLLGVSTLNFVVLDEPTAYLDAERKRSLVGVLSGFADSRSAMQFVIITHDDEIFEDSTVENIIRVNGGQIV